MSIDEQHIALPKLYGAPAYARPTIVVSESPRPFDPDELPIEAFRTDDEQELVAGMPGRSWDGATADPDGPDRDASSGPRLHPLPLRLRRIAGRLLGD